VTPSDPGNVLLRALAVWGLGHLAIGRSGRGWALIGAEVVSALAIAWLVVSLADTNLYLVPFLGGVAFIVAWAWQAVDAYRGAHALAAARPPTPERSPAAAIGLLSLPLLVWGTGFWLIAADSANPEAVLDRFVTSWNDGQLGDEWDPSVVREAEAVARTLEADVDRFRDVRVRMVANDGRRATAVAEAIHFERRPSTFLWIFPGSELRPVADAELLELDLRAVPVDLVGGGDIGAVRWDLVETRPPGP
jgi:hypothetical protein